MINDRIETQDFESPLFQDFGLPYFNISTEFYIFQRPIFS